MTRRPVEPPPSPWVFPWPDEQRRGPLRDFVAVGADLEPGTLLAAYRHGIFPMPLEPEETPTGHAPGVGWWSPVERGVLPLDGLKVSRSLRQSARRFEVRVDNAFASVVEACAETRRDGGWITPDVLAAYSRLHRLGWAHSVECWREDRLVGGLYGVAVGGLFAGESMFHRETDASKVALMGLVELLRDEHADQRLLDVQWVTPHLASLGVVGIDRATYLRRLRAALEVPGVAW